MKKYLVYASFFLSTIVASAEVSHFCKPSQPCWPSIEEWQSLSKSLTGKLEIPQSPLRDCQVDPTSNACLLSLPNLKNPFFISESAGGTQSTGWLGAWTSSVSSYVIAAENAQDITMAVKFAREHNLRLVIKSTGHDYLGRSNAPDSLLVWTHKMQKITMNESFIPSGCRNDLRPGVPAVTAESGATWFDAYQEVTVKNARYVQGGGCTTVGVAGGFMQGGGFGSWSKKYGTGAANMLEAEIVTADGRLLIANDCQNQDLFWALRGGGGGTFGIVTKVTLKTHALPNYFGIMNGKIRAKSDASFKELLEHFINFYYANLNNEHWGEQVVINMDNSIDIRLASQGLSTEEVEKIWKPFREWIGQRESHYSMMAGHIQIPGDKMWNNDFIKKNIPGATIIDENPSKAGERFWWAFDAEQVSTYWYAYQSRWIPLNLFEPTRSQAFAKTLFEASRQWPMALQFNKGLAGASSDALERSKETSMNPAVYQAAALLIVAANTDAFPKKNEGGIQKAQVSAAMKIIREVTPDSGTYLNEADYFEENWQKEFWGENYKKLLGIKKKYDPKTTFTCHHCVGSEGL